MLSVRACARGLNLVVMLLCASELDRSESTCLLGESVSLFIDERDGLTSERERVRMLLSLIAHVSGYRMMVGTHNSVGLSDAQGRSCRFVQVWQMSVPAILLMPRGM